MGKVFEHGRTSVVQPSLPNTEGLYLSTKAQGLIWPNTALAWFMALPVLVHGILFLGLPVFGWARHEPHSFAEEWGKG